MKTRCKMFSLNSTFTHDKPFHSFYDFSRKIVRGKVMVTDGAFREILCVGRIKDLDNTFNSA